MHVAWYFVSTVLPRLISNIAKKKLLTIGWPIKQYLSLLHFVMVNITEKIKECVQYSLLVCETSLLI